MTGTGYFDDNDNELPPTQVLAEWFDQEGGIYDTINGYGLTIERAERDIPGLVLPPEVKEAWAEIQRVVSAEETIRKFCNDHWDRL